MVREASNEVALDQPDPSTPIRFQPARVLWVLTPYVPRPGAVIWLRQKRGGRPPIPMRMSWDIMKISNQMKALSMNP